MKNFIEIYGTEKLENILADARQISIFDKSLNWLNIPEKRFIEYVSTRQPLPFDGVPPCPDLYKIDPTFMIVQAHRFWVTTQIINNHLQGTQFLVDLGAFPFSQDILLREYLNYSGRILATVNLTIEKNWRKELDKRDIQTYQMNLDSKVFSEGLPSHLELKDDSIDMIICSHVIEHLYHPVGIIKEIYRVLKTKGKLIISTDNGFMLNTLLNLFYLKDYLHEPVQQTSAMSFDFWRGHNRFFTKDDIMTILTSNGFEIIEYNFSEILYNSFIDSYFYNPINSLPFWKTDILLKIPAYRNEICIVASKK